MLSGFAGKSIPWGSRERAFEMTKLMAIHRSEGSGSIFYSMAPDGLLSHQIERATASR